VTRRRAAARVWAALRLWPLLALALMSAGCVEWLEVDEPGPEMPERVEAPRPPAEMPTESASVSAAGPIVPGTPGLRVPAGYFARVRLDTADLYLPFAWVVVHEGTKAADPVEQPITVRILAASGADKQGEPEEPLLRGVLPLAVPAGTRLDALEGLDLGADALRDATVSVTTEGSHHWIVAPTRLRLEHIDERFIKGSLEGMARRGTQAPNARPVRIGFVALRGPTP
jgi:hypothetical protein